MRYMLLYPLIITVANFFGVSTGVAQGTWTQFLGDGVTIPDEVVSMAIDYDGILWVGGWKGLWSYNGDDWTTWWLSGGDEWLIYPGDEAPAPWTRPHSIAVDNDNVKWFAVCGGVVKYDGASWDFIQQEDNIFISAAVDRNNLIWFGTGRNGVWSYDGSAWTHHPVIDPGIDAGDTRIAVDSNNVKWVTFNWSTTEEFWGIASFDGTSWNTHSLNNSGAAYTIAADADDVLWIGTYLGGLTRFDGADLITRYGDDHIPGENVHVVAIGPDNTIWMGTNDHAAILFDGTAWATYDTTNGLLDNNVNAIAVENSQVVWFGTQNGVSRLQRAPVSTGEITVTPALAIAGNYPNPFNPTTTIEFSLSVEAYTTLDVFNLSGQHVATLLDDMLGAGTHAIVWDGADKTGNAVSSGMYFCRLQAEGRTAVHRMVLMR